MIETRSTDQCCAPLVILVIHNDKKIFVMLCMSLCHSKYQKIGGGGGYGGCGNGGCGYSGCVIYVPLFCQLIKATVSRHIQTIY